MSFFGFLVLLIIDLMFAAFPLRQAWGSFNAKRRQLATIQGKKESEKPDFLDVPSLRKLYSTALTSEPEKDVLLAEYKRTQEMLTHYDNLNWQIGSILVGSNIVALGFLSGSGNAQLLFAAAFGGSFSLYAWGLWFLRHASIYHVKSDRLFLIEEELHMAQHKMVDYASTKKWLTSIAGNKVALLLCLGLIVAWLFVLI